MDRRRAGAGFHLPGSVLYELHVGTFSPEGDFDGAIQRLDHLVELGVDAVEVMPVAEAMGERGWGYDGVLLYAPHHAYGGPDGFKRFVDACHHRGLGVLLDVVYNHLGPKGNHLERFGPYFTDDAPHAVGRGGQPRRRRLRRGPPVHRRQRPPLVRRPPRRRPPPRRHPRPRRRLAGAPAGRAVRGGRPPRRPPRPAAVAGRRGRARRPRHRAAREAGGLGLDGRWADDLHHAIHVAITGERRATTASTRASSASPAAITGVHGKPGVDPVPDAVPSHRFVVCAQNHDQVGNRATGDRLSHLAGPEAQMAAAALVLCSPGTPMLFMGEEWAASTPFPYFVDVPDDPTLADAIRDGRRSEFAEFGWAPEDVPDPTDPATFESAMLDWDEREASDHARVLAFYRQLLGSGGRGPTSPTAAATARRSRSTRRADRRAAPRVDAGRGRARRDRRGHRAHPRG